MILWGAVVGAVLGWVLAGFEGFGAVLGLIGGSGAGWAGRRAVRSEIEATTRDLRAQVQTLLDERATGPDATRDDAAAALRVARVTAGQAAPPPIAAMAEEPFAPVDASVGPLPATGSAATVRTVQGAVTGWFLGGNTIVRVGLVILFVGLSFLARYAAAAGLFPLELRLGLVAAVGAVLLAVGFRTRRNRPGFALALQGTGVATIYLTIFAGARLFALLPPVVAFGLMIAVCAFACALALAQNAQVLAVASFAGGFAVPLLLGRGEGSTTVLFSYYTVLNLAVLFIAGRRSWRAVNLVGFFATFGAATLWGLAHYDTADYPVAQPFLVASVLIYVAAAIGYARNTPGRHGHVVDATLLFGPALAGFGLQVGMVERFALGSAISAVAFGALYLGLAAWTAGRRKQGFAVLNDGLLAIGIFFLTLAVPLAMGARWTSAAWAIEGAGAVWIGVRQRRWGPRLFGLLLQAVAAAVFVSDFAGTISTVPLANAGFMGAMLIAAAALASAWWLRRPMPGGETPRAVAYGRWEARLNAPVFLSGFLAFVAAWTIEAARVLPGGVPVFSAGTQRLLAMLAFVVGAWGAAAVGRRAQWDVATWPGHATLPVMAATFVAGVFAGSHVLDAPDWAIWATAIAVHMRVLYRNDMEGSDVRLTRATLAGGVLLATAMLADCVWVGLENAELWETSWPSVAFLATGTGVLAVLIRWAGARRAAGAGMARESMARESTRREWPIDRHAPAFLWNAAAPIAAVVLAGASAAALLASGRVDPVPYLPLLNPLDLTLIAAIATLFWWRRVVLSAGIGSPGVRVLRGDRAVAALAGLAFLIVSGAWLRTAHHGFGVAWEVEALAGSFVVQTGLAILWTLLALALMTYAHRRVNRAAWLAGAGLLGLVVVKLMLVDLMNAGGAERIVTFIAVGGLMLVVGYLAPLPPRAAARGTSG